LEDVFMSDIGVKESVGFSMHSSAEVVGVARRRRFSASYKRRILDEVDRAGRGEIGLILRREGLYSSQLSKWRDWRSGMTSKKKDSGELRTENQRLQKENARLKLKLRKAEAMLDLQKKAAEILNYEDETDENGCSNGSDS
jgi:transposase-like protein